MKIRTKTKKIYLTLGVGLIVIAVANTIPLGSYTTVHGCPGDSAPQVRLGLIKGQTLQQVKDRDVVPLPSEGCALNAKYTQHLLF